MAEDLCIQCGQATEFGAMFTGSPAIVAVTVGGVAEMDSTRATELVLTRGAQRYGEQEFFAMAEQDERVEMWLPLCQGCVRVPPGSRPTVSNKPPWNTYEFIPKGKS